MRWSPHVTSNRTKCTMPRIDNGNATFRTSGFHRAADARSRSLTDHHSTAGPLQCVVISHHVVSDALPCAVRSRAGQPLTTVDCTNCILSRAAISRASSSSLIFTEAFMVRTSSSPASSRSQMMAFCVGESASLRGFMRENDTVQAGRRGAELLDRLTS